MQWKRGFKRILLTIAVLWWGYWGVVAYMAFRAHQRYDTLYKLGLSWDDPTNLSLMMMENRASADMANAVQFGIILPVVLTILGLFGWFFYRGFKPKAG